MGETQTRRFKSLQEATGPVPFNMTNDYLFRAVLQENNYVLCGLIRSLLHIPERDKLEAVVTNPIKLGEVIEDKEFYAQYKMMNVKKGYIYSDKLDLRVINLKCTELATDEDKEYQIDYWVKLFKAKTWEEVKSMSEKNEYINEASKTIFQMTEDEMVRNRCYDRIHHYANIKTFELVIEEQKEELARKDEVLAEQRNALAEKDEALAKKDEMLAEQRTALAEKEAQIAELLRAVALREADSE